MKSLKGVLVIIAIFGAVSLLYGVSFANEEHTPADIKLLRDAAVALQKSRPDLAQGLNNYADKEAKELEEMTKEKNEKEEVGEKVESKEEQAEAAKPNSEKGEVRENVEPTAGQGKNTAY